MEFLCFRVIQVFKKFKTRTLSTTPLQTFDIVDDNVTLLLTNFHSQSTGWRASETRTFLRGHRELTYSSAVKVVGLISFVAGFAPLQNDFVACTTTTAGDDDRMEVALLAVATSKLAQKTGKKAPASHGTFLGLVSAMHCRRSSGEIPNFLISLDFIPLAWDVHLGRIWSRRKEVSSLIGIVRCIGLFIGII